MSAVSVACGCGSDFCCERFPWDIICDNNRGGNI